MYSQGTSGPFRILELEGTQSDAILNRVLKLIVARYSHVCCRCHAALCTALTRCTIGSIVAPPGRYSPRSLPENPSELMPRTSAGVHFFMAHMPVTGTNDLM